MDLADIRIRIAADEPELASALADVLIDCVEGGASVSFMWPLPLPKAIAFWQSVIESARRSERVLLVAEEVASGAIVGTVQVVFAIPENQPHRADVAKMLVHRRARRRGLGAALMRAAEAAARTAGKTLLVLDTVTAAMRTDSTPTSDGSAAARSPVLRFSRTAACAAPPTSSSH